LMTVRIASDAKDSTLSIVVQTPPGLPSLSLVRRIHMRLPTRLSLPSQHTSLRVEQLLATLPRLLKSPRKPALLLRLLSRRSQSLLRLGHERSAALCFGNLLRRGRRRRVCSVKLLVGLLVVFKGVACEAMGTTGDSRQTMSARLLEMGRGR
jgi:hypothetical protein